MEIRILRFLLFRAEGLMILGALFMGLGVVSIMVGRDHLPERGELKQVSGILETSRTVRHQRKGNVSYTYELHIKSAGGQMVKLTLSQEESSEEQVRRMEGQPITALFSREDSVWELVSGGTKVIDYEATLRREVETQAFAAIVGPYIVGGGFLISLLGFILLMRRWRRAAAPAA